MDQNRWKKSNLFPTWTKKSNNGKNILILIHQDHIKLIQTKKMKTNMAIIVNGKTLTNKGIKNGKLAQVST